MLNHPFKGKVLAYEVDGFGSAYFMDDANIPSLLSLPYLGFCRVFLVICRLFGQERSALPQHEGADSE